MNTRKSLKIGLGRIIIFWICRSTTLENEKTQVRKTQTLLQPYPQFPPPMCSVSLTFPLDFPVPIWVSQFPTPTSAMSLGPSQPSNQLQFPLSQFALPRLQGSPHLPTALIVTESCRCWQLRSVLSGVQPRAFPFGCQMAHHGRSHRKRVGGELYSQVPEHLA